VAPVAPATGTPTGTVSFTANGTAITGCSSVALSGTDVATCTTSTLAVGSDSIVATYGGDSNFNGSSGSLTQTVNNKTATTTAVTSSVNPSVVNQAVTFTATVSGSGGTPTGTVSFTANGTAITGCSSVALSGTDVATCTTSTLAVGSASIVATYGGNSNFNGSSGSLTQVVSATLTITTTSLPSGQVGVAYSASITATGGTTPYTFTITGLPPGLTANSSGQITGAPTTAGTYTVTATVTDSSSPQQTTTMTYSVTIAPAASGEPAISITLLDQGTASGSLYVDLTVTNTGPGKAASASINQLTFRTLTGSGTVTYNTSLSPSLPIAIGPLSAGSSTTVRLYLTVPGTVTRFTIAENGNVVDISGTTLAYSASQMIIN